MANPIIAALLGLGAPAEALPAQPQPSAPPATTAAHEQQLLVVGRRQDLAGAAISASEGRVSGEEIGSRPLLRSGDLLEFVPGLVATQHSGSGKANQYFLRGFNLDHGTDFATFVDSMPVNMPSHGHGQGWTDLNFLIPEAVYELRYRKGPYHADVGNFSSAGSARFSVADRVPKGVAEVTAGSFGYYRGVLVDSFRVGGGDLLAAAELQTFDGPWTDIDEDVARRNAMLRYSADVGSGRAHLMVMGYRNGWNSPDQVPERAVRTGLISRFGSIDASLGGTASRYSISGGWSGGALNGTLSLGAYGIDSALDLFSNFTYALDDPVNGDQFRQVDDRRVYGFELSQQWDGLRSLWRIGAQGRFDDVGRVGLYRTRARGPLDTVREDSVRQGSIGLHAAHEFSFSQRLRSQLGLRYDRFAFAVDSSIPQNSGEAEDARISFKGSLAYRLADQLELYLSLGQGFHSNDARGATIRIDPASGGSADPVDPLVPSLGAEVGARLFRSGKFQATAALWTLRLKSELLFVGDAGNTEPSRASRRHGGEFGLYYFGGNGLGGEVEVSYADAKYRGGDPAGNAIPGSVPLVVSAGLSATAASGWLASARLRYFGRYPLVEDGRVRSDGSLLVNLRAGREWRRIGAFIDVFNLNGSKDHDVDYFYASRLPGEPFGGVEDRHYHVFQPRSVRLSLRYRL